MLRFEQDENRSAYADVRRVYVYGIVRAEDGEEISLPPLDGLSGFPVRTIPGNGMAALVTSLETSAAGVPFEEELKDPGRAKSLILDHHSVLQRLIGERTVLPMRFGALFAGDEKVSNALDEHRHVLLEALERVEGAREWGVKIYCDLSVLRSHLGEGSPAILAAQGELAAAKEGRAFFLHRRIARLSEEEADQAIAQCVEASRQRLRAEARAETAMKLQSADVHGRSDEMVWNGTLLVAKPAEKRFFASVVELTHIHGPRGFRYEPNGPWPPFSFAACRLGEGEDDSAN